MYQDVQRIVFTKITRNKKVYITINFLFHLDQLQISSTEEDLNPLDLTITPQPLYNTIVGVHSINRVS